MSVTPTEIDALEAGRELDALVAEKVMGWQVIETDDCNGIDNYWLSKDGQHVWLLPHDFEAALPSYSTDIAAAWAVVEKMVADGWDWKASPDGWAFTKGIKVAFAAGTSDIRTTLLICRAALKAVAA